MRNRIPQDWRTVPNLLSFARIVATPFLAWLIVKHHTNIATALFGVVALSDYFDGWIARRTNTVTDLGVVLDPVSDRILVIAALLALMSAHRLPLWLGIPVLVRDVALSVVFLFLSRRGYGKPKVLRVGKTATFGLLFALPALTLGRELRTAGLVAFAVGGVLYYVAAFRYWQDVRVYLASQRTPFTQEEPR